jgi:hypothetical protein
MIALLAVGALYFVVKHYRKQQRTHHSRGNVSPSMEDHIASGDLGDLAQGQWDSQFEQSNTVTPRGLEEDFVGDIRSPTPPARSASGDDDGWGLYDSEQYLPQEKTSSWFETVEVPQTMKNQHLLSNQIGIGTSSVLGSRRNWSHDIRPDPPCPKIANISPWNQSTIMPSERNKSLC